MIKTNPHSRFVLYTLAQIKDSREVILKQPAEPQAQSKKFQEFRKEN